MSLTKESTEFVLNIDVVIIDACQSRRNKAIVSSEAP